MRNGTRPSRRLAVIGIALAVIAFLALNTFGTLRLRGEQLDLTRNRQYTLSDGTTRMLGGIEEPVTLRLYVSRAVREANPFLAGYADRVRDMLHAYADAAGGRITVDYIDPEPYSVEEDRAVGAGLEAIPLGQQTQGYLGLAGSNSTDDTAVLPVLSPERESFLEYDLTKLVYNLAHPEKPVVAVLSSLPINGDPAMQYQPWQIAKELDQFFQLRYLGGEVGAIDGDVQTLLLVQPQNLTDKTLYAIDQFVMRGGKALVFVDPFSEAQAVRQRQQQQGGPPPETASDLPKLFQAWGLEMVAGKVVGDPQTARQVAYPSGGRNQVVDYLPWMQLDKAELNQSEVMTAQLNTINLASAGILKPRDGAVTSFTPLLSSSPQGAMIDVERVRTYPDPFAIQRDFKPGGAPLAMAARITGPAKSAFPGKPEGVTEGPDYISEARTPINVVVVADTDLLDDRSWLANQGMMGQQMPIPTADNASLVANALDYLAGSQSLTDLRGREVGVRPFTKVAEIRRAAETRYRAKEQDLLKKLADLQQKVGTLKVGEGEDSSLLSQKQRDAIDASRTELLDTRRELRETQLALRQDIESLQNRIRFLDIAAVPLLVALFAIGLALFQRVRYRRRLDAAAA